MIKGDENIFHITSKYPNSAKLFKAYGLEDYIDDKNTLSPGKFINLNTVLKSHQIDRKRFMKELNDCVANQSIDELETPPHFMAMLPCGLRNPFKEFTENHILENQEQYKYLQYQIEGNVNFELSYYPKLDNLMDENLLPDVMMASDINNLFHQPFKERFVEKGVFRAFRPYVFNPYLEDYGFSDPRNNYTLFTANMLVMVVDTLGEDENALPKTWSDLLDSKFQNKIVMRGEDNFFCNAVLLPFYKEHGMEAIKKLALNISTGLHPAQMVKQVEKKEGKGFVYIMPYFFAKRIKNPMAKIIWPEDGAIASPVFLMIKEHAMEKHRELLDFIFSKPMGKLLNERLFPSMHPNVDNRNFPKAIKWLGWDFIYKNDIGKLKEEIRINFMNIWNYKNSKPL